MTNRIPYEIVAIEANKLIVRMVLSDDCFYYYDLYIAYIQACGWTNLEFDEETMRHIDKNWDLMLKRKTIIWN